MKNRRKLFILIFVLLIATFFRFYNLMHDAPYFFDPDERNMAGAISQLRLPAKFSEIPQCLSSQFFPRLYPKPYTLNPNSCNLNPHFFAYGQFPLYLAFASDQIVKSILNIIPRVSTNNYLSTSFPSAIFWLRFYSALSSTLTVLLVYLITKELVNSHSGKRGTSASRISKRSWSQFRQAQLPQDDNLWVNFCLLAALLAVFTPGLIQAAHFGTTESLLTFFFLASIYLSFRFQLDRLSYLSHLKNALLLSVVIGLALGSKLTGIFFFTPPIVSLMVQIIKLFKKQKKQNLVIGLLGYWVIGLFLFFGSFLFFLLSSPYNLVEPQDFRSAVFGYEADVATGRFEAFYTRQFVNTTPIVFQAEKVFPYALGLPIFILGTLGFIVMFIQLMVYILSSFRTLVMKIRTYVLSFRAKSRRTSGRSRGISRECGLKQVKRSLDGVHIEFVECVRDDKSLSFFIFIFSFLIYFLPNAFLFAKWTRFMTPIFPFFAIFAGYILHVILGNISNSRIDSGQARMTKLGYCLPHRRDTTKQGRRPWEWQAFYWGFIGLLVFIAVLPGTAFMSIYAREDVRVTASRWIYENIPNNSYILFETANVVDIPLGLPKYKLPLPDYNLTGVSFDFYHIDENHDLYEQLLTHLAKADYFFIPSRRIFANYPKLPEKYPLITKYYQLLFSGRLGFEKVAEFSSYPSFPPFNLNPQPIFSFPDEQAEETFTVFDHPVIRIYRKVKSFTKEEYKLMFENW